MKPITAVLAGGALASLIGVASIGGAAPPKAHGAPLCDETFKVLGLHRVKGKNLAFRHQHPLRWDNTLNHTTTYSKTVGVTAGRSWTVSAEVSAGGGLDFAIWHADIHGTYGLSVSRTVQVSDNISVSFPVPPHTTAFVKEGVQSIGFAGRERVTRTNCSHYTTKKRTAYFPTTRVVYWPVFHKD